MDISSAVHSPRSLKFAISNKDGTCRLGFHDAATLKPPPYGLAVLTFRRPETAVGHHLKLLYAFNRIGIGRTASAILRARLTPKGPSVFARSTQQPAKAHEACCFE
jgi:hypothetical protein